MVQHYPHTHYRTRIWLSSRLSSPESHLYLSPTLPLLPTPTLHLPSSSHLHLPSPSHLHLPSSSHLTLPPSSNLHLPSSPLTLSPSSHLRLPPSPLTLSPSSLTIRSRLPHSGGISPTTYPAGGVYSTPTCSRGSGAIFDPSVPPTTSAHQSHGRCWIYRSWFLPYKLDDVMNRASYVVYIYNWN